MKRVLLIGELNQTVSTINKYLHTSYKTQICMDTLDVVEGMVKVFEPEMAIICLSGVGKLDQRILDYFENKISSMPVLLLGTLDECSYFEKYYERKQFNFITRPTTMTELLEKCRSILRPEEKEEVIVETNINNKKRMHILVVDDSGILLRSVKAMLIEKYDVSVATDGKKALQKAKSIKPDLILLDYEMPVMDGRETLEEIRKDEELMDIPVVFLTSVSNRNSINSVLKYKPEGYLLKPIEQKRMFETIENLLGV